MSPASPQPALVRAIGRWSLVALVVNSIVASGIFGLPDDLARWLGPAAPWAYVIAGAAIAIFIAVYAELASQYREAGGTYLYAREAFGRFAGIQVGWFTWLARLTSAAAIVNIFVTYLSEFWPAAKSPVPRATLILFVIGGLATINLRGVRSGSRFVNIVTVAKLLPMALFILAGMILVQRVPAAEASHTIDATHWTDALVALMFAYGGFEAAVIPAGETKDPRRDMPFALFVALAVITTFYLSIHLVTMWALPNLAQSELPLADAARVFAGPFGAAFIALGAVISTFGALGSSAVTAPRVTYALAEQGDFPRVFARLHPQFRTPHVSILLFAVLVVTLAISGSFIWNAILSGVARLVTYGAACASLIKLRGRPSAVSAFRIPAGKFLAGIGITVCLGLSWRLTAGQAAIMAGIGTIATLNWLAVRAPR